MRASITAAIFILFSAIFCSPLAAQNNPLPFVNNPLVPAAARPGGQGFTLTVNGGGFVNGAKVLWNGSPRATTVVSGTKLTAAIPATDIATAGTIFITVSNPSPGGGISGPVVFEVASPSTSLAFNRTDNYFSVGGISALYQPLGMLAGNLFGDNLSSLAIANFRCPLTENCVQSSSTISLIPDGSSAINQAFISVVPIGMAIGGPYLITSGGSIAGPTRGESLLSAIPVGGVGGEFKTTIPADAYIVATGDFNRDGKVDVVLGSDTNTEIYVLLGNGDGTFGTVTTFQTGSIDGIAAVGDFDGDGILDLAILNPISNSISILRGNGDGTFQSHLDFPSGAMPEEIFAADFNGDGKLDLAVLGSNVISIFLVNGNGTFQSRVDYSTGNTIESLTIGDYNGDGILDLAAANLVCSGSGCTSSGSVSILLGNGDGTFQNHLDFPSAGVPSTIVTGAFLTSTSGLGFATLNSLNSVPFVSVFVPVPASVGNTPVISSISPTSVQAGSGSLTLTVNGTDFVSGSTVYLSGQPRATTFVNSTQLTASILVTDVASSAIYAITVVNPSAGGTSNAFNFTVSLPPPAISLLSPLSVVAGGPAFTLTVNGLNFVSGAVVNFNGTPRTTTFVSTTQLTIAISASDIANQGTINISVTDPVGNGSGGGTSGTLSLTVLPTNTQPVVGGLVPASTTAGGPAFTLTITGIGFTASSVVTFNSSVVASAFISATQLQASIPATAIAAGGTPFVTVANPGGTPSVVVSFTVNNPIPVASSLSPSSVSAGNGSVTLSVTGSNFNVSSTVLVNATSRATTYVSSTSLTATLPATDFAHSGTLNVAVNNPAPGGGTTSALAFIVEDFKVNVQTPAPPVTAGQPANFGLVVAPTNAATSNAVSLVTSGLPPGATATFLPSATIPAGSGSTNVTLSITTTAHSASASPNKSPRMPWPSGRSPYWIVLTFTFLGLSLHTWKMRSRRFAPQALLVALLMITSGLLACGAVGGSGTATTLNPTTGTPAGTYPIVVTATSGSGSISTTVTLTVM